MSGAEDVEGLIDAVRDAARAMVELKLALGRCPELTSREKIQLIEVALATTHAVLTTDVSRRIFDEFLDEELERQPLDAGGQAFFAHVDAARRPELIARILAQLEREPSIALPSRSP